MIAVVWFQALLDGLGAILAFFYRYIPNYGVAIILFTLAIRVLLLPLAVKQIHSMQAMQTIQPKIKEMQRKYKGNRERLNQEMMALYKEHGVNPLGGCLPLIAQLPVLVALFAVLQFPKGLTHIPHSDPNPVVATPQDSRLYVDITDQKTQFLGMNLLCSARDAGSTVTIPKDLAVADAPRRLDCGSGIGVRIGFYVLLGLMILATFYQQVQLQRASPTGQNQQQKMMTRIFPLFFAFIGFGFPAGLLLYWITTSGVQIVQQQYMLSRQGLQAAQVGGQSQGGQAPGNATEARRAGGDGQGRAQSLGQGPRPRRAGAGSGDARRGAQSSRGGRNAGSRKKRRKR